MRSAVAAVLLLLFTACSRNSALPQGPQPYLIVEVLDPQRKVVMAGTIAADTPLEYSGNSPNHQDGFEFHGTLIENTPSGFRFHWRAVERKAGREVRRIEKEEFAPWGVETKLESVAGYDVRVFYAPKPANEYFTREQVAERT